MDYLSIIKHPIEAELNDFVTLFNQSLSHEDGLLGSALEHIRKRAGKRMRPMLILLMAKNFGEVSKVTQNSAVGLELLHTASLVHDDVVDESSERRGQASVNATYDNKVAVLVGDFFVSGALSCAVRTDDVRVLQILSDMGADLALGEIDQIDNARNREITEEVYFNIIRRKTASLFTSCVMVGGISAGASVEEVENLRRYAELLGMCFQIKDDTFDYFSNPEVGKPTGNDLREGKITLPLIYALGRKDLAECEQMNQLVHNPELSEEDITRLVNYAKAAGGWTMRLKKCKRCAKRQSNCSMPTLPATWWMPLSRFLIM